jgi:hypothetical protein
MNGNQTPFQHFLSRDAMGDQEVSFFAIDTMYNEIAAGYPAVRTQGDLCVSYAVTL